VRAYRLDLSDEKRTQSQLAEVLTGAGIAFEREKRLSAGDIVDFLVGGGVALEVKLKGQRKMEIFRQLQRYAAHESVTALVLVTIVAMGLPVEIGGKPAYYATLSRSWM
jgi:hypothetical protein